MRGQQWGKAQIAGQALLGQSPADISGVGFLLGQNLHSMRVLRVGQGAQMDKCVALCGTAIAPQSLEKTRIGGF